MKAFSEWEFIDKYWQYGEYIKKSEKTTEKKNYGTLLKILLCSIHLTGSWNLYNYTCQ